jgi:hypothetical protein
MVLGTATTGHERGACLMTHVTTYRFKPFMTKEESKTLLEAFAEFGNAPGTTAHYIRTDGTGGFVIGDSEDFAALYRNILNYQEFVEFEQHMVMSVEDGVPLISDYVSS